MDSNIIEATNIYKKFGNVIALDGISLNVSKGAIFSLLGPNGAGKTTFIRILTTLLRPDQGVIKVAGYDVLKNANEVRLAIGLTGQFSAVDDILTGRENLELVGRLYHLSKIDAKQKAAYLLEYFGLTDASGRLAKTYSGGMKRRLDLAASLMGNPQILFLDEPTTGLDPQSRLSVWEIIRKLAREGTTIFLTTQYLEEADTLAQKIGVLNKGRIIDQGSPKELKEKLGGNVVEVHLENKSKNQRVLKLLESQNIGEVGQDFSTEGITVKTSDGTKALTAIVLLLEKEKISLSDIILRRPTLDEVFLALTGEGVAIQTPQEHGLPSQTESKEDVIFEARNI